MRSRDLVIYGGLAVAAYFLYKKFSGAIGTVASVITKPLADAYVSLTTPSVVPQGLVIMPNGRNFPTSDLSSKGIQWRGNVLFFNSDGAQYSLGSHDPNGNYP